MKSIHYFILIIITSMACQAYPNAVAHVNGVPLQGLPGMKALIGTPASKGGVGAATVDELLEISRFMDYYASKTGQMANRRAGGGLLTPSNHGALLHNPDRTARGFLGFRRSIGKPSRLSYEQVKNAVRMHKIQDLATNRAAVDGWLPTRRLSDSAKKMLQSARKGGTLPSRLPRWVDNTGELVVGLKPASKSGSAAVKNAMRTVPARASSAGEALARSAGTAIVVAAVAVEGAVILHMIDTQTDQLYLGEITFTEANTQMAEHIGGLVVGTIVALVMTPLGPVATIAGAMIGQSIGEWIGRKLGPIISGETEAYVKARNEFLKHKYSTADAALPVVPAFTIKSTPVLPSFGLTSAYAASRKKRTSPSI